jgi:hypothetical protein
VFPLLIRGTDTQPLVVVHPYLHGYHGLEEHGLSTRQGMYAVPTSWGGQRLTTSFSVAWGLWADFKYRAQRMPHVLEGCAANTKPSPHRTRSAALRHNAACLRGCPAYGAYRPEIPHYVLNQLAFFGIRDIVSLTSLRHLPEPLCGERLSGDFAIRETPETDTPSATGYAMGSPSMDAAPPDPLGISEPAASANESAASDKEQAASNKEHAKEWHRCIERIHRDASYKIPTDPAAYSRWDLYLRTSLVGNEWMCDHVHIMDHTSTTPRNIAISAAFAKVLFLCANHSTDQLQSAFVLRGRGHALVKSQQGCELYQLIDATYRPTGAKWLWSWEDQWHNARQEQLESIDSLRGRLEELVVKLGDGGIIIPPEYLLFRLLIIVCRGPYHEAFSHIQEKICVTDDPEWSLSTLTLDSLTDRLTRTLRLSKFLALTRF